MDLGHQGLCIMIKTQIYSCPAQQVISMIIPYLTKPLKTSKLVLKLYVDYLVDYLFAMFRITEELFKKNTRGNINK